jgi:NADH dehydrogenase FAD-containing subunit
MGIERRKRIIILGGGFGGLYAALRLEKTLARDPEMEILLVNRENFFLFTPMLHEVAASDLEWSCHTVPNTTYMSWNTTIWLLRWDQLPTFLTCPAFKSER